MRALRTLAAPAVLLALLALQWAVGHLAWEGGGLVQARPGIVSGDEPHYLLTLGSLVRDHDVDVRNDYERSRGGGLDAGLEFRGRLIDHHTLLYSRRTGEWGRWQDVYDVNGRFPCAPGDLCSPFTLKLPERFDLRVSPDLAEVPSHPVGFAALLFALLYPLGVDDADLEPRALEVVMLLSWLGAVATWAAGRRAGLPPWSALAAAALAGAASPWLVYGRSFFAETAIGLFLVLGLWALAAGRSALVGLAIVAAAAIKPNFGLVGFAFVAERLWARRPREAVVIASVAAVGGVAIAALNWSIARTLVVAGRDPWRWALGTWPVGDTLFSDDHGLFLFVPWALLPAWALLRSRPTPAPPASASAALLRQVSLAALVHFAILATNRNGTGWCYGPRYWVPLLPLMALGVATIAETATRTFRVSLVVLALLSLSFSIPAALRYRDAFVARPHEVWFKAAK